MGNTGNVYRNIGNVFNNHITIIEKKNIAIHIDIELLSSPSYKYNKVGKKILQKFLILG